MGDEDDGLAELALQAQELVLELLADHRVDRAERLVHEHHRRVGGERAGDPDALLLAAGELGGVALGEGRVEADPLEQLHRALRAPAVLSMPSRRGTVDDVVEDGAVGEEAGVLDDVADAAPQLGLLEPRRVLAVEGDGAGRRPIIRLIIRSDVVLPQPEGPTSTVIWPVGASRLRSSTATVPSGNFLVTPSKTIMAINLTQRTDARPCEQREILARWTLTPCGSTAAQLDLDGLARASTGAPTVLDAGRPRARRHRPARRRPPRRGARGLRPHHGGRRRPRDGSAPRRWTTGCGCCAPTPPGGATSSREPVVRAALAIRANQLLAGGSGAAPVAAAGARRPCRCARRPTSPSCTAAAPSAPGTSPARRGRARPARRAAARRRVHAPVTWSSRSAEALPLMSSNAFVLAEAGLAARALRDLVDAADVVCALSFVALRGNPEAVSARRGGRGAAARGAGGGRHRAPPRSTGCSGSRPTCRTSSACARGPRCRDRCGTASPGSRTSCETMANTASENPVFGTTGGPDGTATTVTHHGGFHAASLALALDTTLLATCRSAQAVQSRVGHALTDPVDDLPLFLADDASGSSGLLIAEYVAASALAVVRTAASTPSSVQTSSVSAGIEDDASFAGEAAARLGDAVAAYRRLLAVELLCAVRTLRMRGVRLDGPLGEVVERARRRSAARPRGWTCRPTSTRPRRSCAPAPPSRAVDARSAVGRTGPAVGVRRAGGRRGTRPTDGASGRPVRASRGSRATDS